MVGQITKAGGTNAGTGGTFVIQLKYALKDSTFPFRSVPLRANVSTLPRGSQVQQQRGLATADM